MTTMLYDRDIDASALDGQRVAVIGPALGGPALDEGRLERPRLLRPGGDHELGDSLENRGPLFRAQLILGQHGVGVPDQGLQEVRIDHHPPHELLESLLRHGPPPSDHTGTPL